MLLLVLALGLPQVSLAQALPVLENGDFEENLGPGTVPTGWKFWEENAGHEWWMAPRAERSAPGPPT